MKKVLSIILTILISPQLVSAQCLPEPNLPPIISISEFDFQNSDQDYVEIFISNPEYTNPENIEVLIDNKNIFTQDTNLNNYIKIPTTLPATTEQILLKLNHKIVDGVCWENDSPAQSELEDLKNYKSKNLTPCFNSETIPSNTHYARKNLYPTNSQNDWQLTPHSTPNQENNFNITNPTPKITIQSGETQSSKPITLNLDGSSSNDPQDLDLTFLWDMGNGTTSTKSNPSSIQYSEPGIYTIQLTVTNSLGKSSTTFKSINYFEIPTNTNTTTTENNTNSESEPDTNQDYSQTLIQITSFLPNPEGTDSNNEWIEITNTGQTEINLENWSIDDQIGQSNPYKIPNQTIIPAQTSLKIYNHQSKINLNNDTDSVRLLTPDNQIFSSFPYTNPTSGKIIYTNSPTQAPTQEEESTQIEDNNPSINYPSLQITEVFPNPEGKDTDKEWIEIYNPNTSIISTKNWTIQNNNKNISLPETELQPNSYTQIHINGLTNSNTTLQLLNPNQKSIQQIQYETSKENQTFSLISQNWIWTIHTTPNQANPNILEETSILINHDEINQTINLENNIQIFYDKQNIPPLNSKVKTTYLSTTNQNILLSIELLNEPTAPITDNSVNLLSQTPPINTTDSWKIQLTTYSLITIAGITFRKPISNFIKTKVTV